MGNLYLWDACTRELIAGPLALIPDCTHVVSGGSDGVPVIRVWCLDQLPHGQQPEREMTEEG